MARRTLVLDVNETLLDLGALAPHFERSFGNGEAMKRWFLQVLLYSNTATLAGPYMEFGEIAGHALSMLARSMGIALTAAEKRAILRCLLELPAHVEVPGALRRLRRAGYRLVTLTNSAPTAVEAQLANSGLRHLIDAVYSVDAVKRFKPAREPYKYVEAQEVAGPAELMLIAAHPWDCIGAMCVGWKAAFVERPGKAWIDLQPRPQIAGQDFAQVADAILNES